MKKARKNRGFTMIEIMFTVSIIGVLAAVGIPAILGAYASAQAKVRDRNIAEVEKAKGVLTLPSQLGMVGAIGLTARDEFDASAISNLCVVLHISDISELTVGDVPITIGTLTEKANYDALTEIASYE
jgi:prepilin-type N-terminal cleavage/methylation domain-containing protein